jgi:hypothetical protein
LFLPKRLMYVPRDARCGPPEGVAILSATSVSYPGVWGSTPKRSRRELRVADIGNVTTESRSMRGTRGRDEVWHGMIILKWKKTPWSESVSELYRPSNRRLSAKLVAIFAVSADRGSYVVSVTDPCGRILDFLDQSRYFFFQVAPHLYSWGWLDPVPDPLLLRKSGSAGNRSRDLWICSEGLWSLDHRGGHFFLNNI